MRFLCLLPLVIVSLLLSAPARARNDLYAVTPQEEHAYGFTFHITSKARPDGGADFRVAITENQAFFSNYPLAELGILKSTKSARSISADRRVPCIREGKALVSVFTVSQKELADPNFCYFYTDLQNAIDDKILFALSKNFVSARLKDFAPVHH